jgi:hypothetical protein
MNDDVKFVNDGIDKLIVLAAETGWTTQKAMDDVSTFQRLST